MQLIADNLRETHVDNINYVLNNTSAGHTAVLLINEDDKIFWFSYYHWYNAGSANQFFSIDYLIGEESYLRKGYGRAIIELLTITINKNEDGKQIIVQPEKIICLQIRLYYQQDMCMMKNINIMYTN